MKKINSPQMEITENQSPGSYRDEVIAYAEKKYGTEPEHLWGNFPRYVVLRHKGSRKWYGLIMDVPADIFEPGRKGVMDILEIKGDPDVLDEPLLSEKILRPAYHMKHGAWFSVLLDGSVKKKMIFSLLDMSYEATSRKKRKKEAPRGREEWIVPANPKFFDVQKAFSENDEILWKQSSHIAVGDIVYLYVAAPVSAILYRCEATKVDIPYPYEDKNVRMKYAMNLKKLKEYDPSFMTFKKLETYGIRAVRGPRRVPYPLIYKLEGDQEKE